MNFLSLLLFVQQPINTYTTRIISLNTTGKIVLSIIILIIAFNVVYRIIKKNKAKNNKE